MLAPDTAMAALDLSGNGYQERFGGVDLQTIRTALTRDHDGGPATPLGTALDAIAEGGRP